MPHKHKRVTIGHTRKRRIDCAFVRSIVWAWAIARGWTSDRIGRLYKGKGRNQYRLVYERTRLRLEHLRGKEWRVVNWAPWCQVWFEGGKLKFGDGENADLA